MSVTRAGITRWLITKAINSHVRSLDRVVARASKSATKASDDFEAARYASTQANERKRQAKVAEDKAFDHLGAVINAVESELEQLPRVGLNK